MVAAQRKVALTLIAEIKMSDEEDEEKYIYTPPPAHREARVEEVIDAARRVWDQTEFRHAIEAAGEHGVFPGDIPERLSKFIRSISEENDPQAAHGHLMLAEPILRRIVSGRYSGLDDPQIVDFIKERRVRLVGPGWGQTVRLTDHLDVLVEWVRYYDTDPEYRRICMLEKQRDDEMRLPVHDEIISRKQTLRMWQYGQQYLQDLNRLAFTVYYALLDQDLSKLSDEDIIAQFKSQPNYRNVKKMDQAHVK